MKVAYILQFPFFSDDLFMIDEVVMYDGEWKDSNYSVSGEVLDGVMLYSFCFLLYNLTITYCGKKQFHIEQYKFKNVQGGYMLTLIITSLKKKEIPTVNRRKHFKSIIINKDTEVLYKNDQTNFNVWVGVLVTNKVKSSET